MSDQHFKIYKPSGYLSQFVNNQNKRRNKKLLSQIGDFPDGIMAIGRLDENSEGLLLLTTSGQTSNEVRSLQVEKQYYVQVDGEITVAAVEALKLGVEIRINKADYTTLPAQVSVLNPAPEVSPSPRGSRDEHRLTSWLSITITEGKFRQVRKITAAVGFPTLRLIRVRIGNERLDGLLPGQGVSVVAFDLGQKD